MCKLIDTLTNDVVSEFTQEAAAYKIAALLNKGLRYPQFKVVRN